MSITVVMPSFEGLAAGQTATLRCPVGRTFLQLWLEYTGVTLAQITKITVLANAKQIMQFSAAQLNSMNTYADRVTSAGRLCIDFTRKNLRSRAQEILTGLSTGTDILSPIGLPSITVLTIQVEIGAGATNPQIKATAIQDAPKAPGIVSKYSLFNYTFAAAGDNQINNLPLGDAIYRMAFFNSNISKILIQRNQFTEFERSRLLNKQIQQDGYSRTPTDAIFMLDTGEDGYGTESILTRTPTPAGQPPGDLVGDLRFVCTTTSVNQNVPLLVNYLGFVGA